MGNILELKDIELSYEADQVVLKGINLQVKKGEFITILGPSGCGKTTMLKVMAGLLTPQKGQVFIDGDEVTTLPPEKRNVNTIFQNYALFPLMTVAENIGYGLKLKKMPKAEIGRQVDEILETVDLVGYGDRLPKELSGGQQQRVAIARALIMKPKMLLLDEPLGALDAELRHKMQQELVSLQKKLGITFILITHDQEEAISMSDRIVRMDNGEIKEIGQPLDLFKLKESDFEKGLSRIEFVLEDGQRVVACRKGLSSCMEMLEKTKEVWGGNED
ncbi:MAG: ATP-binding cassette domain-containing protein [Anaerovoracaceae bacterium]